MLAAASVGATLLQLLVVLAVARRILPTLWGFGGSEAPSRVVGVVGLLTAALAGSAASALAGPTAVMHTAVNPR